MPGVGLGVTFVFQVLRKGMSKFIKAIIAKPTIFMGILFLFIIVIMTILRLGVI